MFSSIVDSFFPKLLNFNNNKRPAIAAVAPTIDNKKGLNFSSNEYAETTTIHVGGVNTGITLNANIKKNTNGYVYSKNNVLKKSYNNNSKYILFFIWFRYFIFIYFIH